MYIGGLLTSFRLSVTVPAVVVETLLRQWWNRHNAELQLRVMVCKMTRGKKIRKSALQAYSFGPL